MGYFCLDIKWKYSSSPDIPRVFLRAFKRQLRSQICRACFRDHYGSPEFALAWNICLVERREENIEKRNREEE